MQNLYKSRYSLLAIVIALYLLPIMLLSSYGKLYMPVQKGWNLLSFGLFCGAIGTLLLFWLLCRWGSQIEVQEDLQNEESKDSSDIIEEPVQETVYVDETLKKAFEELQEAYAEGQIQKNNLENELQAKNEELQNLQHECHQLHQQVDRFAVEKDDYQKSIQYELEKQKKLLADSQKTISEQREGIDKKLQQIAHLESKVSDLTYEIKTLIQLAEIENQSMAGLSIHQNISNDALSTSLGHIELDDEITCLPEKQVKNATQGAMQLKRCIDIAQKITGANHYNNGSSRFKDLAVDNYTLDLRRLFESLRMENASVIVLYSQKENKVLFVNNQSRGMFGWSPDKFVQSFADIIESGKDSWKHGIASLAIKNEAQVSLKIKTKSGHVMDVNALLGIIPTGIFRHHVIGVLYIPTHEVLHN